MQLPSKSLVQAGKKPPINLKKPPINFKKPPINFKKPPINLKKPLINLPNISAVPRICG